MQVPRVIRIESTAPPKPTLGTACNGCGVCCLAEPCPIGMVWSRRRYGACAALVWDSAAGHYRCGVLMRSRAWRPLARLVRRWIGAGQGCDCQWELTDAMASSKASENPDEESPHEPQ